MFVLQLDILGATSYHWSYFLSLELLPITGACVQVQHLYSCSCQKKSDLSQM